MAEDNYPNSGMVFTRKQEEGKRRPILSGPVELSRDLLQELVNQLKAGKTAKIDVTVWPCLKDKDNNYEPKLTRDGDRMHPTTVGLPYAGGGNKTDEFEGFEGFDDGQASSGNLSEDLDDEIPF